MQTFRARRSALLYPQPHYWDSGSASGLRLLDGNGIDIKIKSSMPASHSTRRGKAINVSRQVNVIWDLQDDPDGNYVHIVIEHGITQDEVDDVMRDPTNPTVESDSSGRPITFGSTQTGRHIGVVWDPVCDDPYTIKPVTAYEVPPQRKVPPKRSRRGRGRKR